MLQDFPCPITLGQQEACDWTGKREAELRVGETGSDREEEEKNGGGTWQFTSRMALNSHR